MIKTFSLVTIAALIFVGCNSGNSDGASSFVSKNTKAASISSLKTLSDANTASTKSLKSASDSATSVFNKRENSDGGANGPCESGTLDISGVSGGSSFSLDAKNCTNGNSTMNGAVTASVNEASKSGSAEVTRDFVLDEGSDKIFIKSGSKVSLENQTVKADFSADVNGQLLSAENLQATFVEEGDNTSVSFTSGVVNVAGYYFEFVKQNLPFSLGESLTAGKLTLKDGAGHKVVIEVESADNIALKIDENGDGVFSESEILRDSL